MMNPFMDKLRSFLGLRQEPPRNDFRNPIWGSDDDDDEDELYNRHQTTVFNDDDDDEDELYNRHQTTVFNDLIDVHRQISEQMQEMFETFGSMFEDFKVLYPDEEHFDSFTQTPEILPNPETFDDFNNSLRDYYLKPGYHSHKQDLPKEDKDLDGEISSNEISGLLKQKDDTNDIVAQYKSGIIPRKSFCQTIITTSITKPDGTIETRKIIKNGNEVIEETTTTLPSDVQSPMHPGLDSISANIVFHSLAELMSHFRNFY